MIETAFAPDGVVRFGMRHGYERAGLLSVETVVAQLGRHYRSFHRRRVWMDDARYRLFADNLSCVRCGVVGLYFAVERSARRDKTTRTWKPCLSSPWHLNLYALNAQGHEVLMTKDHIVPKSKGGPNCDSNYQTMCTKCNNHKADKTTELELVDGA